MGKRTTGISRAATAVSLAASEFSGSSPLDSVDCGLPGTSLRRAFPRKMNSRLKKLHSQKKGSQGERQQLGIRLKDPRSSGLVEFPCFRESDVFDIQFSYPMKVIRIDEDFDCESSDELIECVVREQLEAVREAFTKLAD